MRHRIVSALSAARGTCLDLAGKLPLRPSASAVSSEPAGQVCLWFQVGEPFAGQLDAGREKLAEQSSRGYARGLPIGVAGLRAACWACSISGPTVRMVRATLSGEEWCRWGVIVSDEPLLSRGVPAAGA